MVRAKPGPEFADGKPDEQASQLQRMARRWRRALRTVFLVFLAVLWLAIADEVMHERRITVAAVAQRDANLAIAVEHYVVRILRTARAVHQFLGGVLVKGRSDAEMSWLLTDRLHANDAFRELGICLPDGRVLRSAPARGPSLLTPEACARIVAVVFPGPEVSVLPPIGPAGALQVPLVLPIQDDEGDRHGVAVALTPVQTMLGIMESTVLHDDTVVFMTGRDGAPRAAWLSHGGAVTDPARLEALRALNGNGATARIDGRTYLLSGRELPVLDFGLHVASSADDALEAFRARRTRLLLMAAAVTVGLLAMYRLLGRMQSDGMARSHALIAARAELQQLNARLDQQVRERTAQLEQAYSDLETFSYAVAHDVRAPLAGIAGFAEAMEPAVAAAGDPKQAHYLNRIQANAAQMEELTRHLLDLGRLTRSPIRRVPVDLGLLATQVIERLREAEPARNVDATIAPQLRALGDEALLRQVLENLLGNAWKFTSRRSPARIELSRAPEADGPGTVAFVVSDNGEGFDSDDAPGLFQPFRRMHAKEDFPGTGVGLAAVRRIIELHGGRVWSQSRAGAGARFFFSLPAA